MPKRKVSFIKKSKSSKNNLLLFFGISVALVLLLNVKIYWSSDNLINSVSTALASMILGLVIPGSIMVFIFWILMLFDALRKTKLVWLIIILFASILGALLYLAKEKPNIIKDNAKALGTIALVLFVLWQGIYLIPQVMANINQKSAGPSQVSFPGFLQTAKIKNSGEGATTYTIKADQGTVRVDVYGESGCDKNAVSVPMLESNEKVIVTAVQTGENHYKICEQGTGIFKQ